MSFKENLQNSRKVIKYQHKFFPKCGIEITQRGPFPFKGGRFSWFHLWLGVLMGAGRTRGLESGELKSCYSLSSWANCLMNVLGPQFPQLQNGITVVHDPWSLCEHCLSYSFNKHLICDWSPPQCQTPGKVLRMNARASALQESEVPLNLQ